MSYGNWVLLRHAKWHCQMTSQPVMKILALLSIIEERSSNLYFWHVGDWELSTRMNGKQEFKKYRVYIFLGPCVPFLLFFLGRGRDVETSDLK